MPTRFRAGTGRLAAAGLLAGLLLLRTDSPSLPADEPAGDGFTPVAPAAAIHAALGSNLKIVRDWLDQKDYASAAESVQSLIALTQLYGYQSTQPAWRDRTAALRQAFTKLAAAAKAKDATGCQKALQECDALLAELAKKPPEGAKATDKDFRPAGTTRQWMTLLDGTYADAKSARTAQEMEHLAYAIAEGVNAATYLRTDPRWREKATAVRQAALQAARVAHDGELGPARQALKVVYNRCEACHETLKQ